MKKLLQFFLLCLLVLLQVACEGELDGTGGEADDAASFDSSTDIGAASSTTEAGSGQNGDLPAGQITAGEWNDLDNWDFWKDLMGEEEYAKVRNNWSIFTNKRVSVEVKDAQGKPAVNCTVQLKIDGATEWTTKTDNQGKAVLWLALYNPQTVGDFTLKAECGNITVSEPDPVFFEAGINELNLPTSWDNPSNVDISFIVDATGSMSDELVYLKAELTDVIERIEEFVPSSALRLSSVFYRDVEDDYLTRELEFTSNKDNLINFISTQEADGGGDYPEAVHTGLEESLDMEWSADAICRIIFLILDAPPHDQPNVKADLQELLADAAEKGVKIIPIAASGIDKDTEFLLRLVAQVTNGTYVFITDHSGIGNDHLEATVGEFEVEFLNDLIVRLVKKYTE